MKIGLIGLPYSGKSTLFQLLTGEASSPASKADTATARVPDSRIDVLEGVFQPEKTTYPQVQCVGIPSWVPEGSGIQEGSRLLEAVRDVDLLVHVVRGFDDPCHPHVRGSVDPLRDADTLMDELILADLALVETRLRSLDETRKKRPTHEAETALLAEFQAWLEEGTPLHGMALDDAREALIRGYTFYTRKPMMLVLNTTEEAMNDPAQADWTALAAWCEHRQTELVTVSAKMEGEIASLPAEDRAAFMADLGITHTGLERLARAAYRHLGLISFFTVGEDEVRAWTIREGAPARKAGMTIHSDIAQGFIRAEVISYDAFTSAGSMKGAREAGTLRLEGREYVVQDGDIITFRFNV